MFIRQEVTHPKSLNDQVSGLQLTLHDAQEGQELRLTQVVHVQLTFLKHTDTEMWELWQENSNVRFGQRFLIVKGVWCCVVRAQHNKDAVTTTYNKTITYADMLEIHAACLLND